MVYRGREEVGLLIWQKWFDAAAKGAKLLYGAVVRLVRSLSLHAGKINSAEVEANMTTP